MFAQVVSSRSFVYPLFDGWHLSSTAVLAKIGCRWSGNFDRRRMEVVFEYNLVQRRVAFGADFITHQHFSHLMSPTVKPRPACGTHARCSIPFVPFMEALLESRTSTTDLTCWN
jgi:hypothetical protein